MAFAMTAGLWRKDVGRGQSNSLLSQGETATRPRFSTPQKCNVAEHNHLALQRNPHYLTNPRLIGPILFDGPGQRFLSPLIRQQAFGAESARCCTRFTKVAPTVLPRCRALQRRWAIPLGAPGSAFRKPSCNAASRRLASFSPKAGCSITGRSSASAV